MGLERLIRSRLSRGVLVASAVACAAIPAAAAQGATHAATAAAKDKTKTCGQSSPCTLSLSSTPPPQPVAGAPGSGGGSGTPSPAPPPPPGGTGGGGSGGGGGGSGSPAFSTINVATHATKGRIESGSQLVGARDAGHKLVCRGYTRRDSNWFEFMLTSNTRFGITYDVTDTIHNSKRKGVHICAGLGYKFRTLSGRPARHMTLPDGTKGYVGLLPLCKEDTDGAVLSPGPCVSFIVESANGSGGTNTYLGVHIPATSQADPWMGG